MKKFLIAIGIACILLVGCGSSAGAYFGYENDPYEDDYDERDDLEAYVSELESEIEYLREQIDHYENGDGWYEDGRTQELYDVIWTLEEFLYNEGYNLEWYHFEPFEP